MLMGQFCSSIGCTCHGDINNKTDSVLLALLMYHLLRMYTSYKLHTKYETKDHAPAPSFPFKHFLAACNMEIKMAGYVKWSIFPLFIHRYVSKRICF